MIYLDNHATTRCDPRVIEAMVPLWGEHYGNPHSVSHALGREAADAVDRAIGEIGSIVGADPKSVVITSGATESNNLAIRGICTHPRQKRRHLVTATSEHPAVLDVFADLQREGFQVTRIPVHPAGSDRAGMVDLDQLASVVDDNVALVSVMWANNEMGAIAPMKEVADICHARGVLLHSDATQAVGRIPVHVRATDVDLISASAHKFYGPKGTGLLIVGNGNRRVRLRPQIVGGGQQHQLRSGTMNPAGIVGMATALRLCRDELLKQPSSVRVLRDRLYDLLGDAIGSLKVNGPDLAGGGRLPGNLNLMIPHVEGAAWISATPEVAFSSGSACSSVEPTPSHVLTALGLSESEARRSVRFGVGRFNTDAEIVQASELLGRSYQRLAAQRS